MRGEFGRLQTLLDAAEKAEQFLSLRAAIRAVFKVPFPIDPVLVRQLPIYVEEEGFLILSARIHDLLFLPVFKGLSKGVGRPEKMAFYRAFSGAHHLGDFTDSHALKGF